MDPFSGKKQDADCESEAERKFQEAVARSRRRLNSCVCMYDVYRFFFTSCCCRRCVLGWRQGPVAPKIIYKCNFYRWADSFRRSKVMNATQIDSVQQKNYLLFYNGNTNL
jgi:hypothetical protein